MTDGPARGAYAGVSLVALATVMLEILLTRIFSVTMYYHFAFMAISVALFGMTVGALLVYLLPGVFRTDRTSRHMALGSLLLAVTSVLAFLTHLTIPFVPKASLAALYGMALTYVVISVPFVCSGVVVCLALTRFPARVSGLYAADLAGAAAGCLAVVGALEVTDGPTAVFLVGLIAALGSLGFLAGGGSPALRLSAAAACALLALFVAVNTVLVHRQAPLLRLLWVKGAIEPPPIYEKWNSFSRIRIFGDPDRPEPPFGWGISAAYPPGRRVRQAQLDIDAGAATVLTGWDGREDLDYLRHDVTNVAHVLRPGARVCVVGSGGGRDLLSALAYGQKEVVGIEINGAILEAVNGRFGGFTGRLDRHPRVRLVNDEARSWLARRREAFDVIQIALIDTWAATSAGAFALTENSLYTVEAWDLFLSRLAPDGILSVTRWYVPGRPAEMYRLVSLAAAALARAGIPDPRGRLLIVAHAREDDPEGRARGMGTLLLSPRPFTPEDVARVEELAGRLRFRILAAPSGASDPVLAALASGRPPETAGAPARLNLSAPTDDDPFFFQMLRLSAAFRPGADVPGATAVFVLGALLVVVAVLTALCIVVPLWLTAGRETLRGSAPLFVYFVGIGLGFMLVEISQMQRLITFLGHPTYALSVVLFSLLLSSGLGSLTTRRIAEGGASGPGRRRLAALLLALAVFGASTPAVVRTFAGASTPARIAVAAAMLMPLGVFMGMAFPLGMKAASGRAAALTPWLWGINGATSVCGSVVAVAVALSAGISASFWTGFGAYAAAAAGFLAAARSAKG